jgi:hypothetical protein
VMTRTAKGIITFWNRRAEVLYGWRKEEAVGRVSHDLLRTQFPQPLEEIESELVSSGLWEGKLVHTTRDGGRVTVRSQWILNPGGQPGEVAEINVPCSDYEIDRGGGGGSSNPEVGRRESFVTGKSAEARAIVQKFADIVLVGGGMFCLLVLSYVVYYHDWSLTSRTGQFLYFVLPGLVAISLFASLALRAAHRINIALCFYSVAFTIYTAEAMMTLWFSLPSVRADRQRQTRIDRADRERQTGIDAAKALGVKYDPRTKAEVIHDLRSRGVDAVPSIFPQILLKEQKDGTRKSLISIDGREVLPLAGMAEKSIVVCNEGGEFLIYTSDRHGFNNPPHVWDAPIDIVAVGDSYVQGYCVGTDENFVSVIRKHHPGTLNLGMAGNGPLVMLATIKEYAEIVKPKVVLWFYCEGNDLTDLRSERQNPLLAQYLTNNEFSQGLFNRQAEIDRALAAYLETIPKVSTWSMKLEEIWDRIQNPTYRYLKNIVKLGQLRQTLGFVYENYVTFPGNETIEPRRQDAPQIELLFNVLLRAKKLVGEWGGSLYFIYLPTRYRYAPAEGSAPNRYAVVGAASKAGLPVIDMHPIFAAQKDPLNLFPLRLAGHYTEEGHRLVAQEVLRSISSTN